MLTLPDAIVSILAPFATLFTNPTWRKAQLLLVDAILTPGQRDAGPPRTTAGAKCRKWQSLGQSLPPATLRQPTPAMSARRTTPDSTSTRLFPTFVRCAIISS